MRAGSRACPASGSSSCRLAEPGLVSASAQGRADSAKASSAFERNEDAEARLALVATA